MSEMTCKNSRAFETYECEEMSVVSNEKVADGIYLLKMSAPSISSKVKPGQFAHFRLPRFESHILRRPFSIYDACPDEGTISVMYQLAGEGTNHMTSLVSGEMLDGIGPVGTGWSPAEGVRDALLVCGGVGVAPMNMLAHELVASGAKVTCLVGAASAGKLIGIEELERIGVDVRIATDDGSLGHHGFVTVLLEEALAADADIDFISICGPKPMEAGACKIALASKQVASGAQCQVSLENRMACGIGACLSCVVDTVEGRKRACVDGPVFEAEKVVF